MCCLLYYYRKIVFVQLIRSYMVLAKWKVENYDWINEDSIKYGSSSVLGKYTIKKYDVMYNNKNQEIMFVNESIDLHEFEINKEEYLSNKNLLVHCSIINEGGDIILDTTDEFRKFCYYYKGDLELMVFFNYTQSLFKKRGINCNVFDEKFLIYLNDTVFTECTYPIRENLCTSFKELFDSKKFV